MKNTSSNEIGSFFPGDEKFAVEALSEMKKINESFNALLKMFIRDLPSDKSRLINKAISESYAGFIYEITLPIIVKFPHLDPKLKNEANDLH